MILALSPTYMVDWITLDRLTPYEDAMAAMEAHVNAMLKGEAGEQIWLLEHPPLYTAGTSAKPDDLLTPDRFEVFETRRGGQYTYHGPGQRVVYCMLDLNKRGRDLRVYVHQLEAWIIATLDQFNVTGKVDPDRVGVWVERPEKKRLSNGLVHEDKVAAIGIRIRKWIAFHGISINLEPELEHFSGIVPCGIDEYGVTSLVDLGLPVSMADLDIALKETFTQIFD